MQHNRNDGNFDEAEAKAKFEQERQKAEKTLRDKEAARNVIAGIFEKLKNTAAKAVLFIRDDIQLLLAVLTAYVNGRYRKIPFKSLAMILAALTYFLTPFDFFWDYVPVLGFLDDAFIIGMVIKTCHDDLKRYKAWEAAQEAQNDG
jgi:uncharacterized membrane protein YkvA (DUF1232 family)